MKQKIILILGLLLFTFSSSAEATETSVSATVGKYNFSVSGIASPFATVVLSSNGEIMASTVANPEGEFVINNALINEGFSDFCLESIDIKRIGDSLACLEIEPATSDTSEEDIFLPPTIGVSARRLVPDSSIYASGYSMPGSEVSVNISSDIVLETEADIAGYYRLEIKDLEPGKYQLAASAIYERQESEEPARKIEIESVSRWESLPKIFLILLIVLAILILLFILLSKKAREKLRKLLGKKGGSGKNKPKSLHHSWMIGF